MDRGVRVQVYVVEEGWWYTCVRCDAAVDGWDAHSLTPPSHDATLHFFAWRRLTLLWLTPSHVVQYSSPYSSKQ